VVELFELYWWLSDANFTGGWAIRTLLVVELFELYWWLRNSNFIGG
jgi:hypothetical protein